MRLSVSTELFRKRRNSSKFRSTIECLELCHKCGFKAVDMAGFSQKEQVEIFCSNWEDEMKKIKDAADHMGLSISQAHAPYIIQAFDSEMYLELMRRSIISSNILGVKWIVIHADIRDSQKPYNEKRVLKKNYDFYAPFVELAKKYNVGIAIENLFEEKYDYIHKTGGERTRFCSTIEELIEIIDAFNDPIVGSCWDFGHGAVVYDDQTEQLEKLGHRLKAIHAHDNLWKMDMHLPLFYGRNNWEKIMPTLKKINYDGDFALEINVHASIPDEILEQAGKLYYMLGDYCLNLSNK